MSGITRRDWLAGGGLALGAAGVAVGGAGGIEVTDFNRSCLRFRVDTTKKPPKTVSRKLPMTLNNVRMLLDSRVVLTDLKDNSTREFVLSASCKSEQVWVKKDVWHEPNADMCMILGSDAFLVYKRWDKADKGVMRFPASLGVQPERQVDDPRDSFDRHSIDLARRPARELTDLDAILAVLETGTPVVSRTEYESANHRVMIEYPVKTVNFSERERYYQVDTGPVLLPDFSRPSTHPIDRLDLAFVAHNEPGWAEFLACQPTPLAPDIKVHHYSRVVRIEGTRNRLFAVD